jgi:hypothetical protein
MADDRVFELPAGFSERLHQRIDKEIAGEESNSSGRGRMDP